MEGVIANFRGRTRAMWGNYMIIKIDGIDSKDKAKNLIGKKVSWSSPAGKEIKGVVKNAHGNSGAIRALFETGMPGQSLFSKVKIE